MLAHPLRILMETSCHICFSFVSSSHAFLGIEQQKTSGNKPLDVQMLQLPYSDFFERVINAGFQQIWTLATTLFSAAPSVRARLRHDLGSKGLFSAFVISFEWNDFGIFTNGDTEMPSKFPGNFSTPTFALALKITPFCRKINWNIYYTWSISALFMGFYGFINQQPQLAGLTIHGASGLILLDRDGLSGNYGEVSKFIQSESNKKGFLKTS